MAGCSLKFIHALPYGSESDPSRQDVHQSRIWAALSRNIAAGSSPKARRIIVSENRTGEHADPGVVRIRMPKNVILKPHPELLALVEVVDLWCGICESERLLVCPPGRGRIPPHRIQPPNQMPPVKGIVPIYLRPGLLLARNPLVEMPGSLPCQRIQLAAIDVHPGNCRKPAPGVEANREMRVIEKNRRLSRTGKLKACP